MLPRRARDQRYGGETPPSDLENEQSIGTRRNRFRWFLCRRAEAVIRRYFLSCFIFPTCLESRRTHAYTQTRSVGNGRGDVRKRGNVGTQCRYKANWNHPFSAETKNSEISRSSVRGRWRWSLVSCQPADASPSAGTLHVHARHLSLTMKSGEQGAHC